MGVTIVTSHWKEDLTWLATQNTFPVVLIDKEGAADPGPLVPQHVIPNQGKEASAYLKYIVENYDSLPDRVAFIHGHETSVHQKHTRPLLDVIQAANPAYGFVPLNNMHFGGEFEDNRGAQIRLFTFWDRLCLGTTVDAVPERAGPMVYDLGAQFVVSRERILRNPKLLYEGWLHIMMAHPDFADEFALILEACWHIVFGEPFVHVPQKDWFLFEWEVHHH